MITSYTLGLGSACHIQSRVTITFGQYKKPATAYKKAKHELVIIGVKADILQTNSEVMMK